MNPSDESNIRHNWELLKQELDVDYFVSKLTNLGVMSPAQRDIILSTSPVTRDGKAERFLDTLVKGSGKCYQTMCNILLENRTNPRYQPLIKALGIHASTTPDSGISMTGTPRQETIMSVASSASSLNVGACAENLHGDHNDRMVSARAPWRDEMVCSGSSKQEEEATLPSRPATPAHAVQQALQRASDTESGNVDMDTLEKELLKIAPTIADLFNKIHTQTTTVIATSEEELIKIKDDNDRLRKTNRTLVEKLNSFQQKIIQLQLENKKLREVKDNEKVKQTQLEEKSCELDKLKDKLLEQKRALEEKEHELDLQLSKLEAVINDNEEQKLKLANLEQLHDEGLKEYEDQQMQIEELQKEKVTQREQIEVLEEKQKMSEHLLYRLEERLIMLEQRGSQQRNKTRPRYMASRPWMNGMLEKSHHANIKSTQPQFPADWSGMGKGGAGISGMGVGKGGKGWSF